MKRFSTVLLMALAATVLLTSGGTSAQASEYSDLVLGDDPLAYWRLGEDSMGLVTDLAGGHVSVNSSSDIDLGVPGLVLDDADTAIRINAGTQGRVWVEPFEKYPAGATGYSVEFFVQVEQTPTGYQNYVGDGEGGLDFYLMHYGRAGGGFRPHTFTDAGYNSIDSSYFAYRNEVLHVVSTWDSASGQQSLYLNGEEADTMVSAGVNPTFGAPINTDNPIYIGKDDREQNTATFVIDEVAIYDYPLSLEQIQAHAAYKVPGPEPPEPPEPLEGLVLSTNVLGAGMYGNGYTNGDTVEIIRQIPNSVMEDIVPYTSDDSGPTIDIAEWIVDGTTNEGFGSDMHGRPNAGGGPNLWIQGDGELDEPHVGFGGHANWIITFDLEDIRAGDFDDSTDDLLLTGRYGPWGGIQDTSWTGGVTQGAIFLDGVRIDDMEQVTFNEPDIGQGTSQEFDLLIPSTGKYLTLAILSGPESTFWDDGTYRDVVLKPATPPSLASAATGNWNDLTTWSHGELTPDADHGAVVAEDHQVTVTEDGVALTLAINGTVVVGEGSTLEIAGGVEIDTGTLDVAGVLNAESLAVDNTGTLAVRGTVNLTSVGEVVSGTLEMGSTGSLVVGEFELGDLAVLAHHVGGSDSGLLSSSGDVYVGGSLTVQGTSPLPATGENTVRIIELSSPDEEAGIYGLFGELEGASVPDSWGAQPPLPGQTEPLPNQGTYLGQGMWFGNAAGEGLIYVERPDPEDPNQAATAIDVAVFQAAPGDTDGNLQIDNTDLQLILAANSFNNPDEWEWGWPDGDFNADGDVNNTDLQMVLATGYFGTGPYPAAAPAAAGGELTVVPEPGMLAMLASGILGLLLVAIRRRRRRTTDGN